MNITPINITELKNNEIFVFGANEAYIHGAGAAKFALRFGAKYGKVGLQGQSYGIPTKDKNIETLDLNKISDHIQEFLQIVNNNKDKIFLVTAIGCGLAGYSAEEIAPLFKDFVNLKNVFLPTEFWAVLNKK